MTSITLNDTVLPIANDKVYQGGMIKDTVCPTDNLAVCSAPLSGLDIFLISNQTNGEATSRMGWIYPTMSQ